MSSIPTEIGNLSSLTWLALDRNQLSSIPAEIGNLSKLRELWLSYNQLNSIPIELGNLTSLTRLLLHNNQLSNIPKEIGNLSNLTLLWLYSNQLSNIPKEIGNLSNLTWLDLAYNRFVITDNTLLTFLAQKASDWAETQTVSPTDMTAAILSASAVQLSWTPIAFQDKGGYYEISYTHDGVYTVHGTTTNKRDDVYVVSGLVADTIYTFRVRTYTPPHDGVNTDLDVTADDQRNELWSDYSDVVTARTSQSTPTPTFTPTSTPVSPTPTFTPTLTNAPTNTLVPPPPTFTPTLTNAPTNTPVPPTATAPPIAAPPSSSADDHEPDDSCVNATIIQPDSIPQTHTFHTTGDTDWTQFTALTAGIYRIEITIPDDSRADVDLFSYTDCNRLPEGRFTETFSPGARLDVEADAGETFYIEVKNLDSLDYGVDVSYTLSVRQMREESDDSNATIPGPAIVVAGRYRGGDSVQDNIDQIAQDAYNLFKAKGRNDSEIFFLATDSTLPNYDVPAAQRNLQLAITDWAAGQLAREDTSRVLTLYLVDHGDRNKLYLDKVNQEVLVPDDLDAWLTTLEDEFPGLQVNVIIEACHAGSFITRRGGTISKAGRVIITSSNEDYDAYVSRHGAEFSDDLITFLHQEYNLGYSFQMSASRVQEVHHNQSPWIDANGNSIPNELEDGTIASLRSFAEAGTLGDSWPPYIAQVEYSAEQTAERTTETAFRAEVRHQWGNSDIDDVWAVVYPPDYTPPTGEAAYEDDGELNALNLDVIEFGPESDAHDARYVEAAPYRGFTQMGVYRVVVHARDVNGLSARPVTLLVTAGHQIFLPTVSR